jgi:hypothetical protein
MMDHVTQDLNSYLDKLDIQCTQQNERERKIERIMKDEEFKKDLHYVCKVRIKEDPATAQNIQAFNRVRNKLHQITQQLLDGECESMQEIHGVTILDLCAIELSKMGRIAEEYAEERINDYED